MGRVQLRKAQNDLTAMDMRGVAAIILGGGRGARLHPLTESRCKPAVCFGGRYKLIDVPISNALNAGCNKIYVLTQFLSYSLNRHIVRTYVHDSMSAGFIDLIPAEEKPSVDQGWYEGTADAVRKNLQYFEETTVDYFLILSGDQLYNIDFKEMFRFARESDAEVCVATISVSERDAPRMGIIKTNAKNKIVKFIEKPQDPKQLSGMAFIKDANDHETCYLASMGIYLFKRETLLTILKENPGHDFGKDIIPALVKKGVAKAFLHKGYWEDIGTIESFYKANIALTQRHSLFDFYDQNNPVFAYRNNLPGPKIYDTTLSHTIVCEGSIVETCSIKNSVLGPRTVIGFGTTVENCYLMGNDFYETPLGSKKPHQRNEIGKRCVFRNVIVDKHVKIGDDVTMTNVNNLRNYDSPIAYIRDGIIVIPRGVTIPDGFTL